MASRCYSFLAWRSWHRRRIGPVVPGRHATVVRHEVEKSAGGFRLLGAQEVWSEYPIWSLPEDGSSVRQRRLRTRLVELVRPQASKLKSSPFFGERPT